MRYRAYRIDDVWHAGTSDNNAEFECSDRLEATQLASKMNDIEDVVESYRKAAPEVNKDMLFELNDFVINQLCNILRETLRERIAHLL